MKEKLKKRFTLFLVIALVLTSGFLQQSLNVQAAAKISISATKLTIQEGASKTLMIKNTKSNVSWKLNTKKYISIKKLQKNKIKVTGKKAGVTKITASVGKKKYTCKVTVKKKKTNTTPTKPSTEVKPSTEPTKPEDEKVPIKINRAALNAANKTKEVLSHHTSVWIQWTMADGAASEDELYLTKDTCYERFGEKMYYVNKNDVFSYKASSTTGQYQYYVGIPIYLDSEKQYIDHMLELYPSLGIMEEEEQIISSYCLDGKIFVTSKLEGEKVQEQFGSVCDGKDGIYALYEMTFDENTLEVLQCKEYLCDSSGNKECINMGTIVYDIEQPENVTKIAETYAMHKTCENMDARTLTFIMGAGTTRETDWSVIIPKGDGFFVAYDDLFKEIYEVECYTDEACTEKFKKEEDDTQQNLTLYYKLKEKETEESDTVSYADGVTSKMTKADFWADLSSKSDKLLADTETIKRINADTLAKTETNRNDLKHMTETYNGISLRESLANSLKADANRKNYYANGNLVDKNTYFAEIEKNILNDSSATENDTIKYAICTSRTEVKWCPTPDYIGYSATDTDNESVNSAICINDPMVIKAQTADGKFYWGYTENCTGWVAAEDMALCNSKEEWLDAWEVDPAQKDFLVVTTDRIVTETSFYYPDISAKTLTLGTKLKLAAKEDIPDKIDGRGDWNNYIVYLPTRNAEGRYVKKVAMISEHSKVSVGYLPFTERNILNVVFECLGNRYGWGGSLDAMDCSLYVYSVYRCFGFELPRNTTWQQAMDSCLNISGKTDEEKKALIKKIPVGSILYFSGHEMLYLGRYKGRIYVISALGSVYDVGDTSVRSVYSVCINTLDAKRGNGNTWLTNLTGINTFQ